MIARRALLSTIAKTRLVPYGRAPLLGQKQDLALFLLVCKLSSYQVTKNIEHISQDNEIRILERAKPTFSNNENRPLLVLLTWLLAKRKHIMKYVELYTKQGFDVIVVTITPWQLLWPVNGSRLIAADLLEFLTRNQNYQQIVLHGFSVGGYMWGEVCDLVQSDHKKYNNVIDRIVGQVWDSAADVTELSIGVPRAVFPKNEMLQTMLQKYMEYHLKTFYKQSTQYYIRSSQLFHSNLVRTPALFFMSKVDPVGPITSNYKVKNQWDSLGVKTYVKIFDKSPHVGHFRKYPKEYTAELYAFLGKLSVIQNEEKIRTCS